MGAPQQPGNGFTMFELIIVLLVIGVLAAVVVPRMTLTGGGGAVAEADMLRANLRFAQTLAMANNTGDWSVQIAGQSYLLLRNGNPAPVGFPPVNAPLHTLENGVQITVGMGVLEFDEMGAPSGNHTITLSDGANTEAVTVFGFTGLIP